MRDKSALEIESINKLRKSMGFKEIKREKTKCLKCDKYFFSSSNKICHTCRFVIDKENYGNEIFNYPISHNGQINHYVYRSNL